MAGTAVCFFGIVGCLSQREQEARISYVSFRNERAERYPVEVIIEDAGATVYSDTHQLDPRSEETTSLTLHEPVEGYGQYLIRARMAGETVEVDLTEYVNGDEDCIGVTVSLKDDGRVDAETDSLRQC